MFEREHHRRIARILQAFDSIMLQQAHCFFAGGTAIVMALGEYRESRDIDFLCASAEGYRLLRNTISQRSLGTLLKAPLHFRSDIRADRYGIRTFVEADGVAIRLEIISEGRIPIGGAMDSSLNVPVLARTDLYAEKLLANADRGQDRSTLSRDIIDLAMMIRHWGPIPKAAWQKARDAYGLHVEKAFAESCQMVADPTWLKQCLNGMRMEAGLGAEISQLLRSSEKPD